VKVPFLHVVPNLPPHVTGVGDYAVRLAERLSQAAPWLQQSFVCAGATSQPSPVIPFPVTYLAGDFDRAAYLRELLATGDECPLVVYLHYVGYGYARRGAPVWLPRILGAALKRQSEIRLFTMFHELYASGFPWQSSFWLGPAQRRIASVLARLSHCLFTNQHTSAAWLNRQGITKPAVCMPICSNVGEPKQCLPWGAREPVAALFGGSGIRELVYRLPDDAIRIAFDRAGIERVWDIGPPTPHRRPSLAGRPVTELGLLRPDDVGLRLGSVRLGLHPHPVRVFTKSTVAAAYVAHAVPILSIQGRQPTGDYQGPAYLPETGGDESTCADVAMQGFRWYRRHAHSTLAARRVLRAIGAYDSSFVESKSQPA
jgi:hypothetical protein